MARRNPVIEAIVTTLEQVNIKPTIDGSGRSHPRVLWTANGRPRFYVVGRTPSCHHAPKNARSDVRRMLREDGVAA